MARLRVGFDWLTGLKQPIFRNVRLVGSRDRHGRYSHEKRIVAIKKFTAPDGCPAWRADVRLDDAQRGWTFVGRHRRHPALEKRMGHPAAARICE